MSIQKGGHVYITTNKTHSVLYIGVTSNIAKRIWEHKNKTYPNSFTSKYNCDILVYYNFYPLIEEAIYIEKSLKDRSRKYKIDLINELNPEWRDLYDDLTSE